MITAVFIALLAIVHPVTCQIALDSDLHGKDPDLDFQPDHLNPVRVHFTTFSWRISDLTMPQLHPGHTGTLHVHFLVPSAYKMVFHGSHLNTRTSSSIRYPVSVSYHVYPDKCPWHRVQRVLTHVTVQLTCPTSPCTGCIRLAFHQLEHSSHVSVGCCSPFE